MTDNAIDQKKGEGDKNDPNFKQFSINYITSLCVTIGFGIFFIGTIGLYTSKIAQANILPDNIDLAPYTVLDRIVNETPIDINVMKPTMFAEAKDTFSQKVVFNSQEYLDSFKKGFICSIKSNADPNKGIFSNAALYFSSVYENVIAKNFLAVNSIFYYLSYLPESLIMILYGLFGILIWVSLYFFNICLSIFYHFVSIPQLFREGTDGNGEDDIFSSGLKWISGEDDNVETNKKWEDEKDVSFIRFTKLLMFFFIWIPIGLTSAVVSPVLFTLYSIISPLYATYKQKETNKSYNFIDFLKDTFVYKRLMFFILASVSLFVNSYRYLGSISLVGVTIAIIFAYVMGLYSNPVIEQGQDNFTLRVSKIVKQASIQEVSKSNPKLVEVCNRIPVVNDKMDKIIKNGMFRQPSASQQQASAQLGGNNHRTKKYKFRIV